MIYFTDATEINDYIELLLDNGQTIQIPVVVSEITFKQLKPDKVKDYKIENGNGECAKETTTQP